MMIEKKTCSKCERIKERSDFYLTNGSLRGECKKCTIKQVREYQATLPPFKHRIVDKDARNAYAREYRKKNPEKIKKHKENFQKKNPTYHQSYYLKNKEKK
jgi:hypothetical protein